MGKSKITVTGIPEKAPKVNSDKTVTLLFKNTMTEGVPKGLKNLGESIYLVHVAPKSWRKIADKVKKDSFYIINGEPKARINKKGIPFITVVCFDISLREAKVKDIGTNKSTDKPVNNKVETNNKSKKESVEKITPVKVAENTTEIPKNLDSISKKEVKDKKDNDNNKKKEKKPVIPWYNDLKDKLIIINLDDVCITEPSHLSASSIKITGLNKLKEKGYVKSPIAVRKLDNGKYALVSGYRQYVQGKILNYKTIRAYITELSYDDFALKFNIYKPEK